MFKKMLGRAGVTASTVPNAVEVEPGQPLGGAVHLKAGRAEVEIRQIALVLVTPVLVGGPQGALTGEFQRVVAHQGVRLAAGQEVTLPFTVPVPWETPITAVGPALLPGAAVELRTEVLLADGPVAVEPVALPVQPTAAQDRVLDAVGTLGFQFRGTEVVAGRVPEAVQELGFVQRLYFHPPERYAGWVRETELIFVAGARELVVSLIADRRTEVAVRHRVSQPEAAALDWTPVLGQWLDGLAGSPASGGPVLADPASGGPASAAAAPGGLPPTGGVSGAPLAGGPVPPPGQFQPAPPPPQSGSLGAAGAVAAGVVGGVVVYNLVDCDGDGIDI